MCEFGRKLLLHYSINPMNPVGWFTGLRTCVPQTLRTGFPAFAIGVPKNLPASKLAHVNLFLAILFTSVSSYILGHSWKVKCVYFSHKMEFCTGVLYSMLKFANIEEQIWRIFQCEWRYWIVMDNVEEISYHDWDQKIGFWDRNGGIGGTDKIQVS